MISKSAIFSLLFLSITPVFAQNLNYPGKKDYYFSLLYNFSANNNFQGMKSGYYLTNYLGVCTEIGFQKHTKKIDDFEIKDIVSGQYAKLGIELYTNIFKPKTHFRVIYGYDWGYSQNKSSRTYKFSGPIYGDKYETMNYDYKVNFRVFYMGLVYVNKGLRVTSKLMLGSNKTVFNNRPYTVYAVAGSPFNSGIEFSVGYQIIKAKSKPFKSITSKLYKIIF